MLKLMFCDNPECKRHKECLPEHKDGIMEAIKVKAPNSINTLIGGPADIAFDKRFVKRNKFRIQSSDTRDQYGSFPYEEFYFCDDCVEQVERANKQYMQDKKDIPDAFEFERSQKGARLQFLHYLMRTK